MKVLSDNKDIISEEGIKNYLPDCLKGKLTLHVIEETTSTNSDVKEQARAGEKEGFLLIADKQTGGRGRMGRSFFSPAGTGVYMSLLLRPSVKPNETVLITTAAAVSVCRALDELGIKGSSIKWVNDIFLGSKKVCGILTEGGFGTDGNLDYAVLGVGANIYSPINGFPEELNGIAGNITQDNASDVRNKFIGCFVKHFMELYNDILSRNHLSEYKERSFVIGKEVSFMKGETNYKAIAKDIDENCGLVVEFSDKSTEILNSGEISVTI